MSESKKQAAHPGLPGLNAGTYAAQMVKKYLARRGFTGMLVILLPLAVCEKELQPHDEIRPLLRLTVDHAGKAAKTALKRPHVDALVGGPLLLRQDTGAVKASAGLNASA